MYLNGICNFSFDETQTFLCINSDVTLTAIFQYATYISRDGLCTGEDALVRT